jgi:hypothetical protein
MFMKTNDGRSKSLGDLKRGELRRRGASGYTSKNTTKGYLLSNYIFIGIIRTAIGTTRLFEARTEEPGSCGKRDWEVRSCSQKL